MQEDIENKVVVLIEHCSKLTASELRRGDLMVFNTNTRDSDLADHVGIYLGNGDVMHSTKTNKSNGVQMDKITSKRWTHWAKCKYLNYGESSVELRDLLDRLGKFSVYDVYSAMRSLWG